MNLSLHSIDKGFFLWRAAHLPRFRRELQGSASQVLRPPEGYFGPCGWLVGLADVHAIKLDVGLTSAFVRT